MRELDTITDFSDYLSALEDLSSRGIRVVVNGSDADLTAFYLSSDRVFPTDTNLIVVSEGFWAHYAQRPERLRKLHVNEISYAWDRLIEILADDLATASVFWVMHSTRPNGPYESWRERESIQSETLGCFLF